MDPWGPGKRTSQRDYLRLYRLARTEDRLVLDTPPLPVLIMGAAQTADDHVRLALTADGYTQERYSQDIRGGVLAGQYRIPNSNPFAYDASGTIASGGAYVSIYPILPVTVLADGAGNPPATDIVALNAGDFIDVCIWMEVDTVAGANQYQFDFRTDPLAAVGGIAPTQPDWTAIELPLPANGVTPQHTWGHHMITTVVASSFGIAEGANGDWPNGAHVTFSGFYRYI